MRRLLLPILLALLAAALLPHAAGAAVTPSLEADTLAIDGDADPDRLVLRLAAGAPGTLEIDAGADGSTDFSFDRAQFSRIAIRTGAANDDVRLDESGGAFTATEATTIEGGDGFDALRVGGTAESEEFTVQAVENRVRFTSDTGVANADAGGIETARVAAGGGPDLVDVGDLSGTGLQRVEADLGAGDGARDQVFAQGSSAANSVGVLTSLQTAVVTNLPAQVRVENAGPADDRLTVQAGGGADAISATAAVGALIGLTLDGGPGEDRVNLNGTSGDDRFEVRASGGRARIETGPGSLEVGTLERVVMNARGGVDTISVDPLDGTGTTLIDVDLGPADLKGDKVTVNGTAGPDQIRVTNSEGTNFINGPAAALRLSNAEPGDRLAINGREGDDEIDAFQMAKDKLQPFLDGGPGKDVLRGSPGQDEITGGQGNDVAFLAAGLDTFRWVPGDGNDIVEGGLGDDFLRMEGSGADERFDVSALGGRMRVTRDVAGVDLDLGDVERLDINPAEGADTMRVRDLSGTDAKVVAWELAPFRGTTATDKAPDAVLVDGTNGTDAFDVKGFGQQVRITGLQAAVEINRSEPALDTLRVDSLLGTDTVTVAPAVFGLIAFGFVQ
jgi:hypothetical protein